MLIPEYRKAVRMFSVQAMILRVRFKAHGSSCLP